MKFMRSIKVVAPVVALLLGVSACDNGLTEINKNPNQPESVPASNLLAGSIRGLIASTGQRGAFGYWTQMYNTELWVQHVAQSSYNDEDHYIPRAGLNENIWTEMYASLLNLKQVGKMAQESGDANLDAVAEIMSVYGWQVLTDLFGDIPYTEALRVDEQIQSPKYDAQADIYTDLLARLTAAEGKIDPSASVSFASGDLIYDGDMAKWQEFANSLRLRIAMRMADTDRSADARTAFQAAWNEDRFDSNSDNAELVWNDATVSPINEMIVKAGRTQDFRVSATLVDTLTRLHDPRLAIYADPAVSDGKFRGLPNGDRPADVGLTVNDISTIGAAFVAADAPSVLMSYSDMLFLGAEAAARGWISGDAAELYRSAVRASLQQYGISDAAADTYLAQPSVSYNGLSSIYLQNWIALYLAGPEAFSEYRRTGVPALQLSAQAVEDVIPTRIPYPANESLYNPDNFEAFKDVDITDPVWWAKE
jgi:hypothetical protein